MSNTGMQTELQLIDHQFDKMFFDMFKVQELQEFWIYKEQMEALNDDDEENSLSDSDTGREVEVLGK